MLMNATMALVAKRDQVLLGIFAGVTTESFVVDLQIRHRAARLTSPAVTSQYVSAKIFIQLVIKPKNHTFCGSQFHDA